MARRQNTNTAAPTEVAPPEVPQEDNVSTATAEAPEAEDTKPEAEDTKPEAVEVPFDLTEFEAAVEAAVTNTEARDETTGELVPALIEPVNAAFSKLEGTKAKNAARKSLNKSMKEAMNQINMPLARSYMILSQSLTAGGGGGGGAKAERVPTDPTEAFVQRVVGLRLAANLAKNAVPEGVKEDWTDKANELYTASEAASTAYLAWYTSTAEDKGDEPEATAVVKAAVKLAQGKSAKVGGSPRTSTPHEGPRHDIGKHITEAFADVKSGTFLTVSEIKNHKSTEYGDEEPSAGAISARLFPSSGKPCSVEGIVPGESEKGHKGAAKA